jgi:peptidyl-prolyl cis-trans isomerase C
MTSYILRGKLPGFLKLLLLALVALTLAGLPFAVSAQDSSSASQPAATDQAQASSSAEPAAPAQPDPKAVVATVGGQDITEADLSFAAEDIGQQQLQQIPADQVRSVLLAQMIDLKLMAEAGHAANVENSDLYKMRLSYLVDRALRRAYTQQAVGSTISDADIKAAYDKQVAALPQQDEVHARHILVSTEDDAKAIKAQLDAGADFATLAKAKSIEPGAKDSGGDLGYFTQDKMVKPFADAAFALKVNQISDPVQTQFGWHIIQVLDRRPAAKPSLDELGAQIAQQLYAQKYQVLFDQLKGAATIDIPDPTLKQQVDAQLAPQQ